jgi:predicted PolB exonuclease-like 3'-5' exonuclease
VPYVIAWDLETIPDISGFAAANDLFGKLPDEVRGAMGNKFPKHIYHEIICIFCAKIRFSVLDKR